MKLTTLAWTTAATAATAAAGAAATDPGSSWYIGLRKPRWQPPALAFPIVWTALYADLAVASAVALDRAGGKGGAGTPGRAGVADPPGGAGSTGADVDATAARRELRAYRRVLAANLVLNASWSWFFWRSRRPWLGAAEAAVLAASSADLVRRTYRLNRAAGVSLAPYAAWCGFATILSAAIARLNPSAR
ncbi:TspO/MBR family protein [Pseudarthrobacter sp. NPDC092439]|uniref:TspO/MBR family protein n=1 Tax=unclassified Pseudarthrobacter TaxID=2647000 RepID=UPI00381A0A59